VRSGKFSNRHDQLICIGPPFRLGDHFIENLVVMSLTSFKFQFDGSANRQAVCPIGLSFKKNR